MITSMDCGAFAAFCPGSCQEASWLLVMFEGPDFAKGLRDTDAQVQGGLVLGSHDVLMAPAYCR